jgi:hypothetical protein
MPKLVVNAVPVLEDVYGELATSWVRTDPETTIHLQSAREALAVLMNDLEHSSGTLSDAQVATIEKAARLLAGIQSVTLKEKAHRWAADLRALLSTT